MHTYALGVLYVCVHNGVLCVFSVADVCGEEWSITYQSESTCAFVGSSVDMYCSYTYPNGLIVEVNWAKHKYKDPPDIHFDPDYSNRVSFQYNSNYGAERYHLRIKSLTKLDSGEYYCMIKTNYEGQNWIGTPGIYLDVKGKDKLNISTPI